MPVKYTPAHQYTETLEPQIYDNLAIHWIRQEKPRDADMHIMPVIFTVKKGEHVSGDHQGPAVVYVIEGDLEATEESGELIRLKVGDILTIEQGTIVHWNSSSYGKGLAVIYAPVSMSHPNEMVVRR